MTSQPLWPKSKAWISTVSGNQHWFYEPKPDNVTIEDIARHTSKMCRFGGALPVFYSVAQHMVMCAMMAPDGHKLAALLHDSAEAYIGDIPTPLKMQLGESIFQIEAVALKVIGAKFGVSLDPLHPAVVEVDQRMLITEAMQIKKEDLTTWGEKYQKIQPYPMMLFPMTCEQAEEHYLRMFHQLTEGELRDVA